MEKGRPAGTVGSDGFQTGLIRLSPAYALSGSIRLDPTLFGQVETRLDNRTNCRLRSEQIIRLTPARGAKGLNGRNPSRSSNLDQTRPKWSKNIYRLRACLKAVTANNSTWFDRARRAAPPAKSSTCAPPGSARNDAHRPPKGAPAFHQPRSGCLSLAQSCCWNSTAWAASFWAQALRGPCKTPPNFPSQQYTPFNPSLTWWRLCSHCWISLARFHRPACKPA
jgi:hypothetical protein